MIRSSFFVERLVIIKSGRSVYDEAFHQGINVIRGDHSVGKTTILEILFYVLGGEIKDNQWLYPADHCDEIYCQVNINGKSFTIKRDIEKGKIPPIRIQGGSYDATTLDNLGWKKFGPRRSESGERVSFSQQLFDLLGWDNHKSDDYANLTMHQVLRFLYVDQETGSTKIFRAEDNPRGDSEGTRTAIAEFLLGLDNLDTHKLRQQLIFSEREFDKVAADLNAMYKVLGSDSGLTLDALKSQVIKTSDEIVSLQNKDVELKTTTELEVESAFNYKDLEKKVDLFSRQLQSLNIEIQATTGEIVDCELFGDSLDFRKKSLLESKSAFDCIGAMKYTHCPCCLEEINYSNEDTCHLCHTPNKESHHSNNYMQILTELDFQIKSNAKVLGDYKSHLEGLKSALVISESQLKTSQSELQSSSKTVDIETQGLIKRSKKIGYLESEIKHIEKQVKIITELDEYKFRKSELNKKITELREKIAAAAVSSKNRRDKVNLGICEKMLPILHSDLRNNGTPYEEVFGAAKSNDIEIDFSRDRTLIDGRVKFSGSSNYIKKNAFYLAALLESLSDPLYRLPRFLMLDAIENGGMKAFRSHNFQRSIVEMFKDKKDFQIIFCTSMALDDLNNDEYGVGPYYVDNVIKI
ncbi:hypothetical protein AOX56_13880 [Aeromonas sobria]|uniref:Rad50/SbcC-type AAA domain-containing protein n=1 Tax=Aeromonas sobria TaxID=646 RepID=A0A2N3J1X3_AERSO|nr:hypothetical protein [Aeromonas sobria]PKQ79663.1 hypothetical protein AOX56_13880 [Aeromonas sobria]